MSLAIKAVLEPVYVLHHRPYRDSSLILDLLTPAHGRIALVARGARRPKSRLHGLLQPFQPLLASWLLRRELGTLTAVEARDGGSLRGRAFMSGFYVNELLLRLLHRHDPHPQLFVAYEAVMQGLGEAELSSAGLSRLSETGEQSALRLFEMALLRELGYGLVLDHDVAAGDPIEGDAVYYYYPDRGPVREDTVAVRDGAMNGYVARDRPVRLCGGSLLALATGELRDPLHLRDAKRLMRAVLDTRLGGKPLASRSLFRRRAGHSMDGRPEEAMDIVIEGVNCT